MGGLFVYLEVIIVFCNISDCILCMLSGQRQLSEQYWRYGFALANADRLAGMEW